VGSWQWALPLILLLLQIGWMIDASFSYAAAAYIKDKGFYLSMGDG
jgi:hypothetical protein